MSIIIIQTDRQTDRQTVHSICWMIVVYRCGEWIDRYLGKQLDGWVDGLIYIYRKSIQCDDSGLVMKSQEKTD